MNVSDSVLGIYVGTIFGPYASQIAGAIFALILVVMLISFFRMILPEVKSQ